MTMTNREIVAALAAREVARIALIEQYGRCMSCDGARELEVEARCDECHGYGSHENADGDCDECDGAGVQVSFVECDECDGTGAAGQGVKS